MKTLITLISLIVLINGINGQVTMKTDIPSAVANNSDLLFEVKINKGSIANFTKYQLDVPEGITINEIDIKTGSFTFINNRAKVIWAAIPAENEVTILLKLISGSFSGMATFNQKFYYIDNGVKKEVEADPLLVNFTAGNSSIAKSNPSNALNTSVSTASQTMSIATKNTVVENTSPVINATNNSTKNVTLSSAEKIPATKTPEPKESSSADIDKLAKEFAPVTETKNSAKAKVDEVGLVYRVQIGASADNPSNAKYSSLQGVSIVKEAGFYKVLVGSFKSKEDAIKKKTELMEKGFSGFVVAYQDGLRVK
jgi:hypothetical protein